MGELIPTQARDFTEAHRAASLAVATTVKLKPGRGAIQDRIRTLEDHLQESLPAGDILQPGSDSPHDDTYIAHLGPTYEYTPASLRARQVGAPILRRWAAIESAPESPVHLLSLVAGDTGKPYLLFALRTSGHNNLHEVPVYFAMSKEGTQIDELQEVEATAGLPLQLRLATGGPLQGRHGQEIVHLPDGGESIL